VSSPEKIMMAKSELLSRSDQRVLKQLTNYEDRILRPESNFCRAHPRLGDLIILFVFEKVL
jgi:hypothetical protein